MEHPGSRARGKLLSRLGDVFCVGLVPFFWPESRQMGEESPSSQGIR